MVAVVVWLLDVGCSCVSFLGFVFCSFLVLLSFSFAVVVVRLLLCARFCRCAAGCAVGAVLFSFLFSFVVVLSLSLSGVVSFVASPAVASLLLAVVVARCGFCLAVDVYRVIDMIVVEMDVHDACFEGEDL